MFALINTNNVQMGSFLCYPHRAKLSGWLASKGKTLKRPAMSTAPPSKTKSSAKPKPNLELQPQPATQCKPEPEPCLEAQKSDQTAAAAAQYAVTQAAELTVHSQTSAIMNTSLDLLENSDGDLPLDPEDRMDDVRKHTRCQLLL